MLCQLSVITDGTMVRHQSDSERRVYGVPASRGPINFLHLVQFYHFIRQPSSCSLLLLQNVFH